MTEQLEDALARLADRAPRQPLDVAGLSTRARRRRRGRALAVAAPVLALVVAVPLALTAGDRTDRLSQPAAPPSAPAVSAPEPVPLDRLQAVVDVEVVTTGGATPTLAAAAPDQAYPLGDGRVAAPVELTAVAGREVSFLPLVELLASAQADGGTALLGLSGTCGRPGSCAAALVLSTAVPGTPATAVLQLQPRTGDRQTAPGRYRLDVPLDGDQLLRIVVDVAERPPDPGPTPPPTSTTSEPPASPGTTSVQVFFGAEEFRDCSEVRAVERRVPATEAVATAALRELFAGTTSAEREQGLTGYGPETAGLLRSARVEDGTAYVDLDAGVFPGDFTTSCGGSFFVASVTATVTQFSTVDRVVLALDGDPRAFVEALQGGCEEPVAPGGPCDPAPFRGAG